MDILLNNSACTNTTISDGFCHDLPVCGYCYNFNEGARSSRAYDIYNLIVIGIVLPVIGLCGLVGNAISMFIYSRKSMRSSMNNYLCALAVSDGTIIVTAFFLFFIENLRHRSLMISKFFAILAPVTYPLGLTAQSLSVFLTVVAAMDCFVLVHSDSVSKPRFCTCHTSYKMLVSVISLAALYNSPHLFEINVINCWSITYSQRSIDVCPTDLRQNQLYMTVYYAWMYTVIMAIGPVITLIVINTMIIYSIQKTVTNGDSDVITLVLVVCLFIACNILPLTTNFFELVFGQVNPYMVDLSNLMVVVNSSCNFLIYYAFGSRFRKTLREYVKMFCHKPSKQVIIVDNDYLLRHKHVELLI